MARKQSVCTRPQSASPLATTEAACRVPKAPIQQKTAAPNAATATNTFGTVYSPYRT